MNVGSAILVVNSGREETLRSEKLFSDRNEFFFARVCKGFVIVLLNISLTESPSSVSSFLSYSPFLVSSSENWLRMLFSGSLEKYISSVFETGRTSASYSFETIINEKRTWNLPSSKTLKTVSIWEAQCHLGVLYILGLGFH